MKARMILLAAVLALTIGSMASAGVFVHAGPVNVAVGRRVARPVRPVYAAPRPVVAAPAVVAPAPAVGPVAPTAAAVRHWRHERWETAHEAIENAVENAIQNAGP